MALTVTQTGDWSSIEGNQRTGRIQIAFDSAYPSGGEALAAGAFGLRVIEGIDFESSGRHGYIYYTDTTLPATSVDVEILCPTGGATAPTSVAAPTIAPSNTMAPSGGDSTTLATHTHAMSAITGGRGIEMGAADASSLTAIWVKAWGY